MEEINHFDLEEAIEIMRKISKPKIEKKPKLINKKCKICNTDFKISIKYDGDFPLCLYHRDPNNRN